VLSRHNFDKELVTLINNNKKNGGEIFLSVQKFGIVLDFEGSCTEIGKSGFKILRA